jgi:hypothetical protein
MSALLLLAAALAAAPAPAPTPRADPVDAVFAALDSDRDGTLSRAEFRAGHAALQKAIATEVRLRDQFRAVDRDRSGAIEAAEYSKLVLVRRAGASAPAFAAFDADGDAKLGFGEYLVAVRRLASAPQPQATSR